jgi:hypothetical protein
MSKASELLQRLQQQHENREAIQAYWLELFPERGELKQTQVNSWLTQYDFDTIIAGLDAAVIKVNKVDHAVDAGKSSEEMTASRVIKYASMCMRNAGLTDEERQALDDKREALRAARSAAGKRGNAKRWGEPTKVADDLRSDPTGCDVLPRYTGTGTGTDTSTSTDTGTGRSAASPQSSDPFEEKKEQTKTNTNPVGASGVSPTKREEQNQKPTPTPVSAPVKHSWKNCPKCGDPLYRSENHVCAVKCTCFCAEYGDTEHYHGCAVTLAANTAKYGSPLGNVDEL